MNSDNSAFPIRENDGIREFGLTKYEYLYCCCLQGMLSNSNPDYVDAGIINICEWARGAALRAIKQMNNPPTLNEIP